VNNGRARPRGVARQFVALPPLVPRTGMTGLVQVVGSGHAGGYRRNKTLVNSSF